MIRIALFVALVFLFVGILRVARLLLFAHATRRRKAASTTEAEMVRDPICGTWIDRRLALPAGAGRGAVPVCSERCRRELESR